MDYCKPYFVSHISRGPYLHWIRHHIINPFMLLGFFLYPLKTSENQRFSYVFRGYRKRQVVWNELGRSFFLSQQVTDILRKSPTTGNLLLEHHGGFDNLILPESVCARLIKVHSFHYYRNQSIISRANQLTGFYDGSFGIYWVNIFFQIFNA